MNVLKPSMKTTIKVLLSKGISHREIASKTGINRRTIRRYARMFDLDAIEVSSDDSKYSTLATGFRTQNAKANPIGL
jgi:DNA-binding NarL/FixJ family response regulator